jgi:hypothetical protein
MSGLRKAWCRRAMRLGLRVEPNVEVSPTASSTVKLAP